MAVDNSRMKQNNKLETMLKDFNAHDMITVYYVARQKTEEGLSMPAIFSALVPEDKIEQCLKTTNWDLMYDKGKPYLERYMDGSSSYLRFGNDYNIQPLVISRNFFGIYDSALELSEEFRLYYNLYYDKVTREFLKVKDDGNTERVADFSDTYNEVRIRWKELNEFLCTRQKILKALNGMA